MGIIVPDTLVQQVRSGAHTTLGHAAEAILEATARPEREADPSCYAAPMRRFDRTRSLLDAIGWQTGTVAVVVYEEHTDALLEALWESVATYPEDAALSAYAAFAGRTLLPGGPHDANG